MSEFKYPWHGLYAVALTELDASKLKPRVHEARMTLQNRLRQLEANSDGAAERSAIHDALFMLDVILKRG